MTNARIEWQSMTPEAQLEALRKMAATTPRRAAQKGWNITGWMGTAETWEDSLDLVAGQAWMDVGDVLETVEADKPLAMVLAFVATGAAAKLARFYEPHSHSRAGTPQNATAEELDRLPCGNSERPETLAILRDSVARMCRDDLDREIVAHALRGATQREIAQATGANQGTVSRRLMKMRARYDG